MPRVDTSLAGSHPRPIADETTRLGCDDEPGPIYGERLLDTGKW